MTKNDFTRLREGFFIASTSIHSVPCSLLKLETEHKSVMEMLDVFYVCEIWLNKDIGNSYSRPNFDMYSLPGINNDRGGVLIYAKKFLNGFVVPVLCSTSAIKKIILLNFEIGRRKLLVGSIHRPSLSSVVHFIDELEDILQCINLNSVEHIVVLAEDVNINLLVANYRHVELYLNTIISHGFLPQVYTPTKVTSHSTKLIDYILDNKSHFVSSSFI